MKKFILFLLLVSFFSCSDDANRITDFYYTATLEEVCGEKGVEYCITENSYDKLTEMQTGGDSCNYVTVTLTNGQSVGGYARNWGKSGNDCS